MAGAAASALDWEFVAISAIAAGARLRVGEALTMRPDAQLPSRLRFYSEKSRHGWQTITLGLYLRAWAKFLAKFRGWQGLPATASLHDSRADPEASTARLLQGSPYAALRFHAFGRFGAATLWQFSRELWRRARDMEGGKARALDAMLWAVRAEGGMKRGGGGGLILPLHS